MIVSRVTPASFPCECHCCGLCRATVRMSGRVPSTLQRNQVKQDVAYPVAILPVILLAVGVHDATVPHGLIFFVVK